MRFIEPGDPPLQYFPPAYHDNVTNPAKAMLMMENGELHPYALRWLCKHYPRNSESWYPTYVQDVFWDIEMQMLALNKVYRTAVVFSCLLNLHKKMLLWTFPRIFYNGSNDLACHMDFESCFELLVYNCIMSGRGLEPYLRGVNPVEDPRALDQAFVTKLDHVLWINQIEGSDWRVFKWPSPRDLKDWFHGRLLKQPDDTNPPDYFIPELPIPEPGPCPSFMDLQEAINIWRRPDNLDNLEGVGFPRM